MQERFDDLVQRGGPDDCWPWLGVTRNGYGMFAATYGHSTHAHRFAYQFANGEIPDGRELDHVCHNRDAYCTGGYECRHRRCVNPSHLEAVTRTEHQHRTHGEPGSKTHCPQGHAYDEVNTYHHPQGSRVCRRCTVASQARYEKRKRAGRT